MDSALLFLQTHVSFFRLDDIWARSEIKYSAKMGFLRVDLLAHYSKKPAQALRPVGGELYDKSLKLSILIGK